MFRVLTAGMHRRLPFTRIWLISSLSPPPLSSFANPLPCRRERRERGQRKVKDRDWVMRKKERQRKQGKHVANDSKYTARKRRPAF